jgi:2-polyprenyl-6-hydroxyphenyl methylase/3-demethylubiquinone-9 3-methyltransferase
MTAKAVNNEVYRTLGHAWWDDDVGDFSTIRFFVNPVRVRFFERVFNANRKKNEGRAKILDVGCGGGLLAEELARAGHDVTGIDPAPETIDTARSHASASGLTIAYEVGSGEHLPFAAAYFDHVVCCDVLEHVDDVERVVAEIARVLKPGGLFLYDTINRTLMSKLAVIKVMQEWQSTAFAVADLHVWEKFITPAELSGVLLRQGLKSQEMRGISIGENPIAALLDFRRRARGRITFKELGHRLGFHESGDLSVSFMGYASKTVAAQSA